MELQIILVGQRGLLIEQLTESLGLSAVQILLGVLNRWSRNLRRLNEALVRWSWTPVTLGKHLLAHGLRK